MFTGIVENLAPITTRTALGGGGARLSVARDGLGAGLDPGVSVAVNGVCLTVAEVDARQAHFDIVPETLLRTNLGRLQAGQQVNLERSLRADGRFDGHFVQGHVDGIGQVTHVSQDGDAWILRTRVPGDLTRFLVPKGSITIDGVSLTIVAVEGDEFTVALIPTTLQRTTLAQRRPDDLVNIETDILARLIVSRVDALLGSRGALP